MGTVTIGSADYDVYAEVADADEYLAADFDATLWRDETDSNQKARALVSGTRLLDRQLWPGEKTDEDQPNQWPRTGTGISGVDEDTVPEPIIDASIVLAKLIHAGSKVDSQPSTQSGNIKRQRAGSVEVEYFVPVDDPTRLPTEVQEMLAPYLAGSGRSGAVAFGTDGCSVVNETFGTTWPG